MKNTLLILSFLLSNIVHSQDFSYRNKYFVLLENVHLKRCNAVGGNISGEEEYFETLESGWQVLVEATVKEPCSYVISVVKFKYNYKDKIGRTGEELNRIFFSVPGDSLNVPIKHYFSLPCEDAERYLQESERLGDRFRFSVGLPIATTKIRLGDERDKGNPGYFAFEPNVNLGLSFGIKYIFKRNSSNSVNFLFGFSNTFVPVDSLTTNGFVTESSSKPALSIHSGWLYEFNQIQIGLYAGFDFMSGEIQSQWIYRNLPWIGIGFGYNIFVKDSKESESRKESKNQKK